MTRISSSVGLITGIPIEETVTKLMAIAARPRDLLKSRNDGLKQQQLALDSIGARLLSFQFAVNKLKGESVFQTREVASSNTDVLEAALPATGTASVGAFQVRPVRPASAQQLISQRFASAAGALGGGLLAFRSGGHVDTGIALDALNGGAGVERGKIRLTDRSGAVTTIDLSFALTVDDVIAAINSNSDVSVIASTDGDSFVLTDNSGGSGNLRVQEVAGGSTAAGLGLAGVNVATNEVAGSDVLALHTGARLASLNDGNGVSLSKQGVVDLAVTLSDGTELSIDLHDATTLGDVVTQINAANPAKLAATIAADGRRLELTDLSGGAGDFSVVSGAASSAAEDLGIAATVNGLATITGERLVAGLRDTLLSRLKGGQGVAELGDVAITDRNGGSDTVDLSGAETLGDVIALINASSAEVTASVNAARNGIVIADASGGSGVLSIANADVTNSADALQIEVAAAVASVNSGGLERQTLSRATLLSSLNGGKGVTLGDIRVTDTDGVVRTADLDQFGVQPQTVGDVIDAINTLTNGVEARINDTGDGILIVDTVNGDGGLAAKDLTGNLAQSLKLTRASKTIDIEGTPTKVIDGTASYSVDLDDLALDETGILLSSLNGGKGVAAGDVLITDSQGRSIAIDFNGADAGVTTVGQLIELINDKAAAAAGGFGVTARINDAGSGILLEDTAGGSQKLTVRDVNSTTAADLKLTGTVVTSGDTQTINGAGAFSAGSAATGLNALAARINDLQAGVTASTVFDGFGYRLSLGVDATGTANELLIDAGETGFVFDEVSKAQDALLLYGNVSNSGAGVLLSSPDGEFASAIGGVDATVKAASEAPVTVTVRQTDASFVEAVEDIVESYNSLRSDLDKLTAFDADAATIGLLFGTNEALQIDSRLSQVLTSRFFGVGSFQSLEQVGLSVTKDGALELNKVKLQAAYANDPEGIETFFTDAENGVAKKINAVVERIAGSDDSLLAARSDSLKASIEANDDRLEKFALQLERQQERLFLQFFQLETVIANMQASLSAVQNLQPIPPLGS